MTASQETGRVADPLLDNAEAEAGERPDRKNDSERWKDARLDWWREARYGMFIHWGLYSLLGGYWKGQEVPVAYGEHIMLRGQIPVNEYEKVAESFNPVRFAARAWVKAAKDAGMKYIVITAKHHDGFAMYDSNVCDFTIVKRTPFGRDPLMELAEACREAGIRLGFYYSHSMDWHHPDSQGNTHDYPGNIGAYDSLEDWIGDEGKRARYERYLNEKAFPQLEELLTRYGPVSLIWFDCGHKVTDEQGSRFVELVRGLQPDCLVNSRVRRPGFGDYINSGDNQVQMQPGKQGRDWESIHTMNRSWGYKRNDNDWKTSRSILENMIDVFSQNGNYLLNVGPPADGEFDEQSVRLLTEIGRWMKLNGDAVYGSEGSPIGKPQWGRCTRKGSTLYLHVFDWPKSGELVVQGVRSQVAKAYALVDDTRQPLPFARLNDQDIGITVGSTAPTAMIPVIVLEIGGVLDTSPVRLLHPKDYINVFGAFDGRLKGNGPLRFDTGKKDRDVVKDWSDTGDSIVWTFRSSGSGLYRVTIIYGADNDSEGGQFTVESAGQVLTGTVKASGDAYHFAPHWLGMFEIPQAGDYELRVRAQTIPRRSLMHLQKVELEAAGRDVNDVVY